MSPSSRGLRGDSYCFRQFSPLSKKHGKGNGISSSVHSYFLGLSVMVRPLCASLGRHRAEILTYTGQGFCPSSCEAEGEHIMAVLYLLKAQKGFFVDVGDGEYQ